MDKEGKKYPYLETELFCQLNDKYLEDFYKVNNSFIQKSFFIEIENYYIYNKYNTNNYYKNYEIKCALVFDNLQLIKREINDTITIRDLLDTFNKSKGVDFYQNEYSYKYLMKIKKCPDYLIIIVDDKNYSNYQLFLEEEINISKYCSDNSNNDIKYELVYFIRNYSTSFLKYNNKWIQYKEDNINYDVDIKSYKINLPCFAIYKIIENNNS